VSTDVLVVVQNLELPSSSRSRMIKLNGRPRTIISSLGGVGPSRHEAGFVFMYITS
jgi:hypothetical protein